MVENQPTLWTTVSGLQALRSATTRLAGAALPTAYLIDPGVAQHPFSRARFVGSGRDKDPGAIIREPRIVQDRPRAASRVQRVQQDAENGGQRAEENRHFEHDDDVRRDRADRLAADHNGPVLRHPQRQPRADTASRDAADQREHADRAHRRAQRVLDLVPGNRRVDREVIEPPGAQLLDRVERGIEMGEHAEHAGRRGCAEQRRQPERGAQWGPPVPPPTARACPRRGGASTSFTSEIETAGKFFTNRRNHMKNQPKLPAMMPQSAQVGLYVALANRSNGSPASDTTMITKRSNHIPMFTKIEMTNRPVMLVWTFFDQ